MSAIPSKWATVEADWGEAKKHIFSPDDETFKFHEGEDTAREHAAKMIAKGSKMVALLEVKTLFVAKAVEFDQIA